MTESEHHDGKQETPDGAAEVASTTQRWDDRIQRLNLWGWSCVTFAFVLLALGVVAVVFAPWLAQLDVERSLSQLREQIVVEQAALSEIDAEIDRLSTFDFSDVEPAVDGSGFIAVGTDGKILSFQDAGRSWTVRDSRSDADINALALAANGELAAAAGDRGVVWISSKSLT